MSPEKWDEYNIGIVDDMIDLIKGWVEYFVAWIVKWWDRVFRE